MKPSTKSFITTLLVLAPFSGLAQMPPPRLAPEQLDRLADRIALYPDPLLAQILAASTYAADIPEAFQWADRHHYLRGQELADAIRADNPPWDPSVQALLPFPSVLEMMATDMNWTQRLGDAFLVQQPDVMDAVQRERDRASRYGYLRSNAWINVDGGAGLIAIMPVNSAYMPVPWYDPAVVFFPPMRGISIAGAIRFGFRINIGIMFAPWGWGANRFDWVGHVVIVNNSPWLRNWAARESYLHPYSIRQPRGERRTDPHRVQERTPREREAPRRGQREHEDHRRH